MTFGGPCPQGTVGSTSNTEFLLFDLQTKVEEKVNIGEGEGKERQEEKDGRRKKRTEGERERERERERVREKEREKERDRERVDIGRYTNTKINRQQKKKSSNLIRLTLCHIKARESRQEYKIKNNTAVKISRAGTSDGIEKCKRKFH